MNYKYYAVDKTGKLEHGRLEADAESTAKNEIKNRGLYLVSLKEEWRRPRAKKKRFLFSFGIKQRLPVQLARQLASLLRGGVPLFQALTIIDEPARRRQGEGDSRLPARRSERRRLAFGGPQGISGDIRYTLHLLRVCRRKDRRPGLDPQVPGGPAGKPGDGQSRRSRPPWSIPP